MTNDSNDDAVQPTLAIVAPELVRDVATLIEEARQRAALRLNEELTTLYWHVGKRLAREDPRRRAGRVRELQTPALLAAKTGKS